MGTSSQFALLRERRFLPFFLTQLAGALNDNLLKSVLVLLATYKTATFAPGWSPGLVSNLAAALFIVPFVLFSATAGQLADRYDKTTVIRAIKLAEVGIMALATAGLIAASLPLLLGALFCMGLHSAFFGPVKYSVLPRVLADGELVGGNALVETGTFLAILAGTIFAGWLVGTAESPWILGITMMVVAAVGAALSFMMPQTGSAQPELRVRWNPFTQTGKLLREAKGTRAVWLALLGISWFWFFGALYLAQFPGMAQSNLHGDTSVVTLLLATFSVGVAGGSLLCERLSGHKVEIGLVPFGSLGMTVFAGHLYFSLPTAPASSFTALSLIQQPWAWWVLADVFGAAFFGGLYIVPLYALVQTRTPKERQSRIIAANNVLNSLFMVGSAGLAAALIALGASVPQLLLAAAVLNAFVAMYIYSLVPEFLWRLMVFLLVNTVYRVRAQGLGEAIPESGPALLVANHVSFVDALVLQAVVPRPIRFIMDYSIFKTPGMSALFRAARAIPIASAKSHPAVYAAAIHEADVAFEAGEVVAIFPEGRLSADGDMAAFRSGYLRLLENREVPVIAVGLAGLWGSAFSRKEPRLHRRFTFREVLRRVGVAGRQVASHEWAEPDVLRMAVQALHAEAGALTGA